MLNKSEYRQLRSGRAVITRDPYFPKFAVFVVDVKLTVFVRFRTPFPRTFQILFKGETLAHGLGRKKRGEGAVIVVV
jgi:hypothetical protein